MTGPEYRVLDDTESGKVLVSWRPDDTTALWVHVATVDNIHKASNAMATHRDARTAP